MMGAGIAGRLLGAGHDLRLIAHRRRGVIDELCSQGASEARDWPTLADGAEAVFLCLPGADDVRGVCDALLPHMGPGSLVIDVSTSLPALSRDLAGEFKAKGADFIDAPVNGGPDQARDGTLGSMVGGHRHAVARARPLLEAYSRAVQHFGGPGSGNAAKLINNFISLGQAGLIVEAFRRCDAMGLERGALYDLLKGGAAASGTLEKMLPAALKGTYDGHRFGLGLAAKDARYIADIADELGEDGHFAPAICAFFEAESSGRAGDSLLGELLRPRTGGDRER